jgi:hypothetical protein
MTTPSTIDCALCIDGFMPAGIDPIFGPAYRACFICTYTCAGCAGMAIFPAMHGYLAYLIDALYHLGYEVDLCRCCLGITAVYPTPQEQP